MARSKVSSRKPDESGFKIPTSKEVNSWKGPRLAFDWAYSTKGCVTHDGRTFASCMDIIPTLKEKTLIVTESTFCSYSVSLRERQEFIDALYKAGHMIGCIPTKTTGKERGETEKSDLNDAKAIYSASLHHHLIIPQKRDKIRRDNKFTTNKRYLGFEKTKAKFPPIDSLDEDSKIAFCVGKNYSEAFIRDFYDAACKGKRPMSRKDFERKIGNYNHGYPCYMRSVFTNRNLTKKNELRLPWSRFRRAIRRMFAYLRPDLKQPQLGAGIIDPATGTSNPAPSAAA